MTRQPIDISNPLTFRESGTRVTRADGDRQLRARMTATKLPAVKVKGLPISGNPLLRSEDERRRDGTLLSARLAHRDNAQRARWDTLPDAIKSTKHPLTLLGRETLAVIYRRSKAVGGAPIAIPRADLGKAIGVAHDHAGRLLNELVQCGAVQVIPGFGPGVQPRYRAIV